MTFDSTALANRRYRNQTMLWMGLYALVHAAAIAGGFDRIIGTPLGWLPAVVCGIAIAAQIAATIRLIRDSDEYQRALLAKRFVLAAGAAMALISVWGFAEGYANVPHAPAWLVYPLFWTLMAIISPFVQTSH